MGDRVVVPFNIACGDCYFCKKQLFFAVRSFQPQRRAGDQDDGAFSLGGLFGYSHMLGGYAGGQAEYLRVPLRRFRSGQGA